MWISRILLCETMGDSFIKDSVLLLSVLHDVFLKSSVSVLYRFNQQMETAIFWRYNQC